MKLVNVEKHDFEDIKTGGAFEALASVYGPELAAEQLSLEHEAYVLGEQKFRENLEKAIERGELATHTTAKPLMSVLIPLVEKGIAEWIDHQTNKVRRKHIALPLIREIKPEVLASVTIRYTLSRIAQRDQAPTVTDLAVSVGRAIEDEHRFGRIREQEAKHFERHIKKALATRNGTAYRRIFMTKVEENMVADGQLQAWENFPADISYHIGIRMLEMLIETTGLIEIRREYKGVKPKDAEYAYIASAWQEKLTSRAFALAGITPRYQPCVVPPKPWVGMLGGGYYALGRRPLSFIRVPKKSHLKRYKQVHMPAVYDAVNIAQRTAWSVNKDVLAVANAVMDWKHVPIAEFPTSEREELPVKPLEDAHENDWKAWRKLAAAMYRKDGARVSRRISYEFTIEQANKFADYEAIFFPYNMDWRGRVYAVPTFNPQGNDMAKGLLQASQGKPVGEEGIQWLMIHGANTAGVDKVDFSQRKQWVRDNEGLILRVAADPLNNLEWTEMDSPFCFLAFCFDWAGVKRNGAAHVSRLPLAFDGSCSGIQHFSAMLRDERGGRAVNLLPSETVQDIYRQVADEVQKLIDKDLVSGTECTSKIVADEDGTIRECREMGTKLMAQLWNEYGITRKVTKRSVMTLAYGSKKFGFADQVYEDTVQPAIDAGKGHLFPEGGQMARYMAGLIWDSVSYVVVAAVEAMSWLQKASKLLAAEVKDKKTKEVLKESAPVYWVTPDGFPVWQEYNKTESRRVDLVILGSMRIQATVTTAYTSEIDSRKQEQGIAPNYVHSQDGCHMRKTVKHGHDAYGIDFFAIIHDSFGTIAADAGNMFLAVRETMVETYEHTDVLAEFRDQLLEQLHESQLDDMPVLPAKGTLDIRQILESDFAFA